MASGTTGRGRALALAFLIQNAALGINFSAYGALVGAIEAEFATSRALASAGLSMLTLALGLLSPLVGGLMRRIPIRLLMAVGILLNAMGYLVIARVEGIAAMLAAYALLIGPGFCLFGVVPCTALISGWFDEGRGRALGILNMPVGNALMPVVAAGLLAWIGLRGTFLVEAGLLLALLPLLLFVKERVSDLVATSDPGSVAAPLPAGRILRTPAFLVLALGVSVTSAGGLVMVTHLVTLATDRGIDLTTASLLLSVFSLAGLIGAPLFGNLADRLGGGRAFTILCFASLPGWLGLIAAGSSLPALIILAAMIGLCSNGIVTLFGHTMAAWLGAPNLGLAMGLCYLLQIPFMFGAGPLAGAMFDASGSYTPTILLHSAAFALMGVVFLIYRPTGVAEHRTSAVPVVDPLARPS